MSCAFLFRRLFYPAKYKSGVKGFGCFGRGSHDKGVEIIENSQFVGNKRLSGSIFLDIPTFHGVATCKTHLDSVMWGIPSCFLLLLTNVS